MKLSATIVSIVQNCCIPNFAAYLQFIIGKLVWKIIIRPYLSSSVTSFVVLSRKRNFHFIMFDYLFKLMLRKRRDFVLKLKVLKQ
ncbi:unnamed protein product [Adineta ricciae]|uniref:Uncharacterized protein n=1 Tax=Adineta ricciae TaxID=249248 RepID=A0A815W083_ADIRI|nr:unnamed protein product [Adineta ricciae]